MAWPTRVRPGRRLPRRAGWHQRGALDLPGQTPACRRLWPPVHRERWTSRRVCDCIGIDVVKSPHAGVRAEVGRSAGRRGGAGLGEPVGSLWARLTERDRRILRLVSNHRVLTTDQLTVLRIRFAHSGAAPAPAAARVGRAVAVPVPPRRRRVVSVALRPRLHRSPADRRAESRPTTPPGRTRPASGAAGRVTEAAPPVGGQRLLRRPGRLRPPAPAVPPEPGHLVGLETWRSEAWITDFHGGLGPPGRVRLLGRVRPADPASTSSTTPAPRP